MAGGSLVDQDDAKSSHRPDTLCPGIRGRSSSPQELIYGSPRVLAYDELVKEQLRQDDATLLEEDRLRAAVRAARYQQALRRYHSRKVYGFEEGNLVLRRIQSAKNSNKLTQSGKALIG